MRRSYNMRSGMRSNYYDLQFIYGILQENRRTMVIGGFAAIVAGLVLGRWFMLVVGGFVLFVVSVEYIIMRIFGERNSD